MSARTAALLVTALSTVVITIGALALIFARPARPDAAHVRVSIVTTLRGDAVTADRIRTALPPAWDFATGQRGRLEIVDDDPDITVYVMSENGLVATYQDAAHRHAHTMLFLASDPVRRFGPVMVAVHEIAHLWCCPVDGQPDGHWRDDAEPGLMNLSLLGQERGVFSDRELRALGLVVR